MFTQRLNDGSCEPHLVLRHSPKIVIGFPGIFGIEWSSE